WTPFAIHVGRGKKNRHAPRRDLPETMTVAARYVVADHADRHRPSTSLGGFDAEKGNRRRIAVMIKERPCRVEHMDGRALLPNDRKIVKYRIRVVNPVTFRAVVTPTSGAQKIEGGPEANCIDRLLHPTRQDATLAEIVGVGDENRLARDPKHLG